MLYDVKLTIFVWDEQLWTSVMFKLSLAWLKKQKKEKKK